MKMAEANDQRQRWVGAVVTAVVVLLIGLKVFGDDNPSNWELGAFGIALLVIFGLPVWARRRGAHPWVPSARAGRPVRTLFELFAI
jgi:hypothetical protein